MQSFLSRFIRNFEKNKFFSILNILGLAIGTSIFLLIAIYVKFESSYEDFNPNRARIYRVNLERYINNELVVNSAENYPAVGPTLAAELPEVSAFARLYNLGYKNNVVITNEDAIPNPISFRQHRFLYADSSFLPMMGYRLISGNVNTALATPNSAVITRQYAARYFGNANPIGKTLKMQDDDNNNELVTVTGVVDHVPDNTHLKFDILFSYTTLHKRNGKRPGYALGRFEQSWDRNEMYTFVELEPGALKENVEAKFPGIIETHNPKLKERNEKNILSLELIEDIHLTSHRAEEPEQNGDQNIVNFLGMIGIFVLVIAWINYINLSTAKAMERAKEVGVRKVMGAFKSQLVRSFLIEAAITNSFSIFLSVAIVGVTLPAFNSLSGLSLDIHDIVRPWLFILLGFILVAGTFLSGFYPALVLSSFKPIAVLKGKLTTGQSGVSLRKSLVVFQFMASVALISGTLIVFNQLDFMMSQDIGMNIDQVLVIERPGIGPHRAGFYSAYDFFRNELRKKPFIQGITGTNTIPGKQRENKDFVKKYSSASEPVGVGLNSMDYETLEVFQMKLLAGRGFSQNVAHDEDTSVVITESASRALGYNKPEEALGQTLSLPSWPWNPIVVGVVNDYHQLSLKQTLEPALFYCDPHEGEYYSIRVQAGHYADAIDHVKAVWGKAFPDNPFTYFFLDDYFNQQYKNERRFGALFTTFSSLALVIACLGLFGLSAYTAQLRTKEIGIRKILGSSVREIVIRLSIEYLKLVGISIILATPIIYIIMNNWIQAYASRIAITVDVFIEAGLAVLLISIVTISFQTIRAARSNPVDSLRYE